jgi:septin 7
MAELHDLKPEKAVEIPSTVKIEAKTFRLVENDVRLKLTVVDTPGFGDLVDNSNWYSISFRVPICSIIGMFIY